MKTNFNYINCKNKTFSQSEYQSLRSEVNVHIENAYKQGFTLASITLVYFAAIFAFYRDLFNIISSVNAMLGCLISFVIAILCGVPTLIIYPFAIKFHDNIRALTCISTYCRVFHEFPSMIFSSEKEKGEIKLWETIHCNAMIPKGNWIAFEYHIISLFAIILTTVLGTVSFAVAFDVKDNIIWQIVVGSVLTLLAFVYILFLIIVMRKTCKNLGLAKMFAVYEQVYFEAYVQDAIEISFLTKEQADEFIAYRQNIIKRDLAINAKLAKK